MTPETKALKSPQKIPFELVREAIAQHIAMEKSKSKIPESPRREEASYTDTNYDSSEVPGRIAAYIRQHPDNEELIVIRQRQRTLTSPMQYKFLHIPRERNPGCDGAYTEKVLTDSSHLESFLRQFIKKDPQTIKIVKKDNLRAIFI